MEVDEEEGEEEDEDTGTSDEFVPIFVPLEPDDKEKENEEDSLTPDDTKVDAAEEAIFGLSYLAAAVVGGGFFFLIILTVVICYYCRKRKNDDFALKINDRVVNMYARPNQ